MPNVYFWLYVDRTKHWNWSSRLKRKIQHWNRWRQDRRYGKSTFSLMYIDFMFFLLLFCFNFIDITLEINDCWFWLGHGAYFTPDYPECMFKLGDEYYLWNRWILFFCAFQGLNWDFQVRHLGGSVNIQTIMGQKSSICSPGGNLAGPLGLWHHSWTSEHVDI